MIRILTVEVTGLFLRLAENLGSDYGWHCMVSTNIDSFPNELTVAGYSGDFLGGMTASVHHNAKQKDEIRYWVLYCMTAI